jgi:hypothetical protein
MDVGYRIFFEVDKHDLDVYEISVKHSNSGKCWKVEILVFADVLIMKR